MAFWVVEWFSRGSVPRLGHWHNGKEAGTDLFSSGWQWCVLTSLELQGWNCAHSLARNQPTEFGYLPHQSVGLTAWPPPVGREPNVTRQDGADKRPFLCAPSALQSAEKNKSHALLRRSNYSALLFCQVLTLRREMLTFSIIFQFTQCISMLEVVGFFLVVWYTSLDHFHYFHLKILLQICR